MPALLRHFRLKDPDAGINPYNVATKKSAQDPVTLAPRSHRPRPRATEEKRVCLTPPRLRAVQQMMSAQREAVRMTVFNEVDMSNIMALRHMFNDSHRFRGETSTGYMPYFVKACALALQKFSAMNAAIDGNDLIYRTYCDIAVTIGTDKCHAAPILAFADRFTLSAIETKLGELARFIDDGTLSPESLMGGTFTITDASLYGSLMSTPALIAHQAGVLALHTISERPVVIDGNIKVRPVMNLALSYDARIVPDRTATAFLAFIKGCVEKPESSLLRD